MTERFKSPRFCVAMRKHRNQNLAAAMPLHRIQISILLPDSAESFSTIWCFSIKGTAPAGRVEEFRLENRLSLPWF